MLAYISAGKVGYGGGSEGIVAMQSDLVTENLLFSVIFEVPITLKTTFHHLSELGCE